MFLFKLYNNVSGGITCNIDGMMYQADKSHPVYNRLLKALKEDDSNLFTGAYDLAQYVSKDSVGNSTGLVVEGDNITYNGKEINSVIKRYIIAMREDGFNIDYLLKFLDNLMKNPSWNCINSLFEFLQNRNMPISEDGSIMAYKTVKKHRGPSFVDPLGKTVNEGDLVDCHSGKYRNNIGDTVWMERNEVDDDRNKSCSYGFHIGALEYSFWGDVKLIVKFNPLDVVSVPASSNEMKIRVCKYEIVGEYKAPLGDSLYGKEIVAEKEYAWYEDSSEYEEEDYDDEEDEDFEEEDPGCGDPNCKWCT